MRRICRLCASLAAGLALFLLWLGLPGLTTAQGDCTVIYPLRGGWAIEMCASDPAITTPMAVVLDGAAQGMAALVRVYHTTEDATGTPQVAVLYASGFVRLKQNDDPPSSIPFGSSFVFGPAYWPGVSTYYHNPQLTSLRIDTSWLPSGPLRLRAEGTNHDFDVTYEMSLPLPRDRQARLHVVQTYTATQAIAIAPTRRGQAQGFKLVQISSMFINEGSSCSGGHTDCHDSNAARFIGDDLVRRQVVFRNLTPSTFIFSSTLPLGNTWLDALHTDDGGWQGNTPNVRIALDVLPLDHTVTPQGWISATTDFSDENVSLWLHDDGPASQGWAAGQSDQVSYWLVAQDDPPEPWADLGLRSGWTFLNFQGSYDCTFVEDAQQATSGTLKPIAGYADTALQLEYGLGNRSGNWVQVRCDFEPPLDLAAYDHLRFDWRGDPDAANSLEIGLVNPEDNREHIFARGYHHVAHRAWWGQLVIPFRFLHPWTEGSSFDPSRVSALFVSVVKDPADDVGGTGSLAIDNLNVYAVGPRSVPSNFSTLSANPVASTHAAQWLASQQRAIGLLKSWEEEVACAAHTYDQALALIVFSHERMWNEANALVGALAQAQNENGSWFKSYDCNDSQLPCIHCQEWEGDIAWAIYALSHYMDLGGTHPQALAVRNRAADWLATHVNSADGCLVIDHTEGTIDAWWALNSAGPAYADKAQGLKSCLLTYYWDEGMGRFKGGRDWQQPYLDNQTWGGAFLRAIGRGDSARRALSYAYQVLRLPGQGGQLFGFDGQGGPWSVWNEGTGQYAATGGQEAHDLLQELVAQQRADGALSGGPDDFNGGGVWTTRWHGVAPTAWLYNALNGEPFHPPPWQAWVPLVLKKP